jgi:hypothetical protein
MAAKKLKPLRPSKAPSPASSPPTWLLDCLPAPVIAGVFVTLALWSWGKWPDPIVDFGQQLYVPWRLAAGEKLYRDIAILNGPLSQYFNAVWFYLFGPSLLLLCAVNLAILAAITFILYRIVLAIADRFTAATAAIAFLSIFAFSQYVGMSNYNYVAPYAHEATHGIALTIAMILSLCAFAKAGRLRAAAIAGALLGLAVLTKIDIALAALATAGVTLVAAAWANRAETSLKTTDILVFMAAAAAPIVGFFLYFMSYLPASEALRTAATGFSPVAKEVAGNPFYLHIAGLDAIGPNLGRMLAMLFYILLFVAAGAGLEAASCRWPRYRLHAAGVLAVALFAVMTVERGAIPWGDIPRAFPAVALLAWVVFAVMFFLRRGDDDRRARILPMLSWTTFALVLLAKVALNARIANYGFYLAMPAAVVLIVCLMYWLPRAMKSAFGGGIIFKAMTVALLAAAIVHHLKWTNDFYRLKNFPLGRGDDTIVTYVPEVDSHGPIVAAALRWIEENTPRDATLVALPEGVMLNYQTRRKTTVPQVNFMMIEALVFGEDALLHALKKQPPDYIILVQKDTSEYGVARFGADPRYGQRTMQWLNEHYAPAALIGAEPSQGGGFGIKFLQRAG